MARGFGDERMIGLYGIIEELSPVEKKQSKLADRRRKAKICYQFTSSAWKNAVYEFATEFFLPGRLEPFIFEMLTLRYDAYAKLRGKPLTVERRAFAGLQQRLLREGLIEPVIGESGIRSQGNLSQKYRSNL